MGGRFDGRVVMVTGGGRGIGRATARRLIEEGAKVAICARSAGELEEARAELVELAAGDAGRVYAAPADVTRTDQVERFAAGARERLGPIDGLVNNAGGATPGRFDEVSEEQWRWDIEMSLLAMFRCARAVVGDMRRKGGGSIVNVNALVGKQPNPAIIIGSSVRAACIVFTKALSEELAKDNIRVNGINVGAIWSAQRERAWKQTAPHLSREEFLKPLTSTIPLGRLGTPEEAAAVIAFLLSDEASYLTGTSVDVGGGMGRYSFA